MKKISLIIFIFRLQLVGESQSGGNAAGVVEKEDLGSI